MYFSQETKQRWSAAPADQDVAAEQGEIDGGALWLPGNTVLELQMLPMVRMPRASSALDLMGRRTRSRNSQASASQQDGALTCCCSSCSALPCPALPCPARPLCPSSLGDSVCIVGDRVLHGLGAVHLATGVNGLQSCSNNQTVDGF